MPVNLPTADETALRTLVTALAHLTWPTSRETAEALATAAGWKVRSARPLATDFTTGLLAGVTDGPSDATFAYLDGNLAEARLRLCSLSREHARADLLAVRRSMAAVVAKVLGERSGSHRGDPFWELDGGGRLLITEITVTVLLTVLHPGYADVVRFEQSRGIEELGDESS